MSEKHKWTIEEEEYCCKRYIEEYVISKSVVDIKTFALMLKKELPDIKDSSLRMKLQNIKQILLELGIEDSLDAKPLGNYSKQNMRAMVRVIKDMNA